MSENKSLVSHQFDDLEQEHEASSLGMWVFLATEVMLFGGLFTGYTAYRFIYASAFKEASHHTDILLGGINTGVLLLSSLMMALAVHAAQEGRCKAIVGFLIATMFLGLVFLGIKGLEYYKDFEEHLVPGLNFLYKGSDVNSINVAILPGHGLNFPHEGFGSPKPKEELFFVFYFFMTGLHAIHLSIAIGIVAVIAFLAWRGRFSPENHMGVELTGLYWHFVDIIWVFLFPLLYLMGRH